MYGVRNRPMPRAISMGLPVGSNRAMSFQRARLVFYWCCSVLFEWCFLALRTRQRQMGVQGTYLGPQTKFEKNNRQAIPPRISRRFKKPITDRDSHPWGISQRTELTELGSILGRSGSFSSIHLWINHGWLGWSTNYQESGSGALDFPQV